jgi:uncharacterized iron-regulated membrane protein
MKSTLRTVHRWISLGVATLWVLQALSGLFLVFHWEIDDALVAGPRDRSRWRASVGGSTRSNLNRQRDRSPRSGRPPGQRTASRLHSTTALPASRRSCGSMARATSFASARPRSAGGRGGWIEQLASFHQTLLAGDLGHSLIGLSGLLLLTNLCLGLKLAWPGRGQWRRTLRPRTTRLNAAGTLRVASRAGDSGSRHSR